MNTKEILDKIDQKESFLLADDGEYLGKLTLNKYDIESILNEYGNYGSKYSITSIYNIYGMYGGIYSIYSPFNQYTMSPPIIYHLGKKYGVLSKNVYLFADKIIDPDRIVVWMKSEGLY